MPRSFTLAAVLSVFAACHLVFAHHPGSGSGDGANRLELGSLELGSLDGSRLEAARPADLRRDVETCAEPLPPEPPGFVTPCPLDLQSCPAANKDCDGLPAGTDPYVSCNARVFEEHFAGNVLASGAWHAYSKHDSWRWSCGKISQIHTAAVDADDEASSAVAAGAKLPAHYMVEARVTLGAAPARPHWKVGVIGRVTDDANFYFMSCSIWVNPNAGSANPVPDPDLVMTLSSPMNPGSNAWPFPHKKVDGLDGSEGKSYTLQLWFTADIAKFYAKASLFPACTTPQCPAVICRVCDNTSCFHSGFTALYSSPNPLDALPAGGGTVGVRTFNRAATFDYVRVYELKNP